MCPTESSNPYPALIPPGEYSATSAKSHEGLVRQVQGGIAVEKIDGLQFEFVPDRRHDGIVFGMWHVVKTHGVPKDDVGVFDRTVSFGPGWQAIAAFAL